MFALDFYSPTLHQDQKKKNYVSSNTVCRINAIVEEHNCESRLKCDGNRGNEAYRWKEKIPLLCLHLYTHNEQKA
jgi:hypothetical protein